jgi:hypothetical protein
MRLHNSVEPSSKLILENLGRTTEECEANDVLRVGRMMLEQELARYPVEYLENVLRRTLNRVIEKKKVYRRILENARTSASVAGRDLHDLIKKSGGLK